MIADKIQKLLSSQTEEDKTLGLVLCKDQYPAIYAALLNYSGFETINEALLDNITNKCEYNMGAKVKYRGMEKSPLMVVVKCEMVETKVGFLKKMHFMQITAKYYNTSSQSFATTVDRVECFEIIN